MRALWTRCRGAGPPRRGAVLTVALGGRLDALQGGWGVAALRLGCTQIRGLDARSAGVLEGLAPSSVHSFSSVYRILYREKCWFTSGNGPTVHQYTKYKNIREDHVRESWHLPDVHGVAYVGVLFSECVPCVLVYRSLVFCTFTSENGRYTTGLGFVPNGSILYLTAPAARFRPFWEPAGRLAGARDGEPACGRSQRRSTFGLPHGLDRSRAVSGVSKGSMQRARGNAHAGIQLCAVLAVTQERAQRATEAAKRPTTTVAAQRPGGRQPATSTGRRPGALQQPATTIPSPTARTRLPCSRCGAENAP